MLKRALPYLILIAIDAILLRWWADGLSIHPSASLAFIIYVPAVFIISIIITILVVFVNKNLVKKMFINTFIFTIAFAFVFTNAIETPQTEENKPVGSAREIIQQQLPFDLPDSVFVDESLTSPEPANRVYFRDFNFDGESDIAVLLGRYEGVEVLRIAVWLHLADNWTFVPEIQHIGTPVLLSDKKILRGFEACCAHSEFIITDYRWKGVTLEKIATTEIANYSTGTQEVRDTIWGPNGLTTRVYALPAGLLDSLMEEANLEW